MRLLRLASVTFAFATVAAAQSLYGSGVAATVHAAFVARGIL